MINNLNFNLVFSIGIGFSLSILALLVVVAFDTGNVNRFQLFSGMDTKMTRFKRKVKRKFKNRSKSAELILDENEKQLIVACAILLLTTSRDIVSAPLYLVGGIILGLVIVLVFQNMKKHNIYTRKVEEIAIMFEAIELYMKAGYTLYQAVKASRPLVVEIRPAIDICLTNWSLGPREALSILQDELNIKEADTLILLLINLETTGSSEMQSAIVGEVFSIESIERMKTNVKITKKPLILMVYRFLPLASVLGIVIGSLLYRTYQVLDGSGLLMF